MRNGKLVLKNSPDDTESDDNVIKFPRHGPAIFPQFKTDDDYIPILSREELDAIYGIMGGAQTNEFIDTNYYAKFKKTDLPGGVFVPEREPYCELEPGTSDWLKERKRQKAQKTNPKVDQTKPYHGIYEGRQWTFIITKAKPLKVLNEVLSKPVRPAATQNQMQQVSVENLGRQTSRKGRLLKPKEISEASWH